MVHYQCWVARKLIFKKIFRESFEIVRFFFSLISVFLPPGMQTMWTRGVSCSWFCAWRSVNSSYSPDSCPPSERCHSPQSCGSGMFIPDPNFFRSRIRIKEFKYFNPIKMVSKLFGNMIRVVRPGSGSWLFYPSRIQGSKRHRILESQHLLSTVIQPAFTCRIRRG